MSQGSGVLYQSFGLNWHCLDLEIPELPKAPADALEQQGQIITIAPEPAEHWPALPTGAHDTRFLRMTPSDVRLTVSEIGRFRISQSRHIRWWREHEGVDDQDLRSYLLGPAMAALLVQRGMLLLHGNALERDGQAIVCLGRSGAGKSTLAYALMQQGWRLLADDLAVITPEGLVEPGIPRIKLWQDAADAFGMETAKITAVLRGQTKFQLLRDQVQRSERPVPLRALYLIRRGASHADTPSGHGIQLIASQKEAILELRRQTPWPAMVRGLNQEGSLFLALARLLQQSPLAILPLPEGIGAMQTWLADNDLLSLSAWGEEPKTPFGRRLYELE